MSSIYFDFSPSTGVFISEHRCTLPRYKGEQWFDLGIYRVTIEERVNAF